MIQTMFLGRVDYERLERKRQLARLVAQTVVAVRDVKAEVEKATADALAAAGFAGLGKAAPRARTLAARLLDRKRGRVARDGARGAARASMRPHAARRRPERGRVARRRLRRGDGRPAIPPISAAPSRFAPEAGIDARLDANAFV